MTTKEDRALTALRQTTANIRQIARFSGMTEAGVHNLAKAHGIKLDGRL